MQGNQQYTQQATWVKRAHSRNVACGKKLCTAVKNATNIAISKNTTHDEQDTDTYTITQQLTTGQNTVTIK